MPNNGRKKIIAILPAYNASRTLIPFLSSLPKKVFDEILLVDDYSPDNTFKLAKKQKRVRAYQTFRNIGYGGNLKYCLTLALAKGADIIVELHPDGEYKPDGINPALKAVEQGAKLVLGNRFSPEKRENGMFWWKIPVLRSLNFTHNILLGTQIPDIHQGFRVYTRELLEKVSYRENSNGFLFSFQIILQALFFNLPLASVPVSTHYRGKKRGATVGHSARYALETLGALFAYRLARLGVRKKIFHVGKVPVVPCLFCTTNAFLTRQELAGKFGVYYCSQCLIGRTLPQPKNVATYYPKTYWAYEGALGSLREKVFTLFQKRRIAWVKGILKKGDVLDVGSGEGKFGERLGEPYRVTNIEEKTAKITNSNVIRTDFLRYKNSKRFDVVTFWESLEHVPDALAYLNKASGFLKRGGFLFIECPSYQCWESKVFGKCWFHLDMPRHTYHFIPRGLIMLLKRLEFEIIRDEPVRAFEYGPWGLYASLLERIGISEKKVRSNLFLLLLTSPVAVFSIVATIVLYFFHQSSIVLVVAKKK